MKINFDTAAAVIICWMIGATAVFCIGDITGLLPDENMTPAEAISIYVFWPFFAIKWLALGIWAVLTAGFSLLV